MISASTDRAELGSTECCRCKSSRPWLVRLAAYKARRSSNRTRSTIRPRDTLTSVKTLVNEKRV